MVPAGEPRAGPDESEQVERLKAALADRYVIERVIGTGGTATVYLKVAVKVFRPELAAALGANRFLREIAIAAQLHHPHILPLYESGEADGFLYYVMPYQKGQSLRERLSRGGELPISEAVRLLRDVVDALAYAHGEGVVHRDIKPDNVMLSGHHAVVMDFGVAKAVSEAAGGHVSTGAGVAIGTPAYMAPEQAVADPDVDHRADLYAVGAVAYEMLCGQPPFTGPDPQAMLAAHIAAVPEHITKHRAAVPPGLAQLVMRCLEKKPADRWQSAGELRQQLEDAALQRASRFRFPRVAALFSLVLVLAVSWTVWQQRTPAPQPGSSDRIVVFPFSVRGGEEFTYLGEGIVDLLSANLDGVVGLRSVGPHAVMSAAARATADLTDPQNAQPVAARLDAGLYVVGNIVEAGGRLRISARLYSVNEPGETPVAATVEATPARLFEMVDELTVQLLAERTGGPDERFTRLAARTTESVAALKAYLEGEQAFRNLRLEGLEAFERAIRLDSTFALAHYRLATVATAWSTDTRQELAIEAVERAVHYSGRLGERPRRLIRALEAYLRDRYVDAHRYYREIVTEYPDDAEAWFWLGQVIRLRGRLLGRSWAEAREAYERVLALEPQHLPALWYLSNIAARERSVAELGSLTDRLLALDPGWWGARPQHGIVVGDTAEVERFVAQLERTDDVNVQYFGGYLMWATGDLVVGRRLWRVLTDPMRLPGTRALAHMTLAKLEVTSGRWRAATGELDSVEAVDFAAGLEHRAYLALTRFLPVERAELVALRASLHEWDAKQAPASDTTGLIALHADVHPYLRLYLLGLLSARLGDEAAAEGRRGRRGGIRRGPRPDGSIVSRPRLRR
jgi:serine/threonine-protein kinase